jgi:NADPH-dependent 2,4-dienoyl-CoA reductase/sulfur reductase-like enzyme
MMAQTTNGPPRRVVIIGASAAGLRCACRLARLDQDSDITVVERASAFSAAACGLPYVLSGDVSQLDALRRTADGSLRDEAYFAELKRVRVLPGIDVLGVDAPARQIRTVDGEGRERTLEWDELVLATGARPRRLPGQVDGPRIRTFHTLDDVAPLQRGLTDGSIGHVAIVGAGPLGCELAEAFRALWGARVTLLEAAAHPLPGTLDADPARIVAAALAHAGVTLRCGAAVEAVEADAGGCLVDAGGERVACDAVVLALGVEPLVELARSAGAVLGPTGAIQVDARFATSVPHVWAAGDCIEVRSAVTGGPVYLPLGSLASREGRTLAEALAGRDVSFPPVTGATAVKAFDCNVAAVGITRAAAARLALHAGTVWITAHDRPHYWPEAREIALQLCYEVGTRRVLGVQVVGSGHVTKRVDVASTVIARRGGLAELAQLEHAYAPPYAPAIDPIAVAAMVAEDQEDGLAACPPTASFAGLRVLDVRHDGERRARPIDVPGGVVSSPNERTDGESVDLVVCERGARAAEVARRRRVRYLGGGLRWRDGLGWGSRQ